MAFMKQTMHDLLFQNSDTEMKPNMYNRSCSKRSRVTEDVRKGHLLIFYGLLLDAL